MKFELEQDGGFGLVLERKGHDRNQITRYAETSFVLPAEAFVDISWLVLHRIRLRKTSLRDGAIIL